MNDAEIKQMVRVQVDIVMDAVVETIGIDGHQWSDRPCQTCTDATGIRPKESEVGKMENCVNWSRLNGDIYRKCPQVYALEAINRESKRKIAAHEIQAYHLNRVNTELQAELDELKSQKRMADMGFMPEGAAEKIKQLQAELERKTEQLREGYHCKSFDMCGEAHDKYEAKIRQLQADKEKLERLINMAGGSPAPGTLRFTDILLPLQASLDKERQSVMRLEAELADLNALFETRSLPANTPPVVCLCGSTRFMDAFFEAGWKFTLEGRIVLSIGVCKHAEHHGGEALGQEVADKLDELHLRKIDLADSVYVLNVGGYIGESTRKEIEYAKSRNKPIEYLEQTRKGDK